MFGISFTEMVVIGVVALIVLGPERLPRAARFAGLWVRRARTQWDSVRRDLERELAADELKRSIGDQTRALREQAREAGDSLRRDADTLRSAAGEARRGLRDPQAPGDAAPARDRPAPAPSADATDGRPDGPSADGAPADDAAPATRARDPEDAGR